MEHKTGKDELHPPTAAQTHSQLSTVIGGAKAVINNDVMPWVEKYRPSQLDQLISHQDIIQTIDRLITSNRLPHLLFYGPPGTGKTTSVLAIARKLNGPNYQSQVLELNASDERGIDVVRKQIKDFASSKQLFNTGVKLIILDEADQMTKTAQFALRRVIEKYTKNTRFCLICNYINKIIPALQSRCTRFRFAPLERSQILTRITYIAQQENVTIEASALESIVGLSEGDMRKCLNVLQACHLANPRVTVESVYLCTGQPTPQDIDSIHEALLNGSFKDSYTKVHDIQVLRGLSLVDIAQQLGDKIQRVQYPPTVLAQLLRGLGDLEHRLAFGTQDTLQLASLVGIFQRAKTQLTSTQ